MSFIIDNRFNIGETVYVKTDKEQHPRLVYSIEVYQKELMYKLACGTTVSSHYDFELSTEINVLTQVR